MKLFKNSCKKLKRKKEFQNCFCRAIICIRQNFLYMILIYFSNVNPDTKCNEC